MLQEEEYTKSGSFFRGVKLGFEFVDVAEKIVLFFFFGSQQVIHELLVFHRSQMVSYPAGGTRENFLTQVFSNSSQTRNQHHFGETTKEKLDYP